jgi:hypothetical protein
LQLKYFGLIFEMINQTKMIIETKALAFKNEADSGCRLRVVKHILGGYSVEKDGKLLQSIFRLKKDATTHMNNLKKVEDAMRTKFEKI